MPLREIVGGQLGRDAAPAAGQPGADHRHGRRRMRQQAQRVGEQRRDAQPDEHDRDRQVLRAVTDVARRGREARPDDADDDRRHRDVLHAPGVLVQHALREEHQHEQAGRQRGLHDDQRRQQQRDELQRPADYRQAGSQQPARAAHQAPGERQAQVLFAGRLLGVHRLQGDP
jgi:hypothetical protein